MSLEDDRRFFPPYRAAPVVREETLQAHPELESLLSLLGGVMDDQIMQGLNYEVDHEKKSPAEVARRFLINKKLISHATR
jgi:glycine betaine/choline ABC-type transport system substrate-binding protein